MRKLILSTFLILFLLGPIIVSAQDIPGYTDLYVNDFASVFTENQTSELRALLSSIEANTTAEVTVLTVDTVSPMAMSQYAQEVFDKWKIGKADKDNGLLILYAKQEDKIWVAVGYGLEGILPDSKVGRILDETFVPMRAENNSVQGIVLAAHEYASVIYANAEEVRSGDAYPDMTIPAFAVLFSMIFPFIMIAIFFYIAYNQSHPKCSCGGRSDVVKTEVKEEKKPGPFGFEVTTYYTLVTYKCRKCKKTFVKRKQGRYSKAGFFLVGGSGGSGGGFGGGSFGGGGFGGGGAGR